MLDPRPVPASRPVTALTPRLDPPDLEARPGGCGEGVDPAGAVCGDPRTRLYPRGKRCDVHAPWAPFHGGTGVLPELRGQYRMTRGHRNQTPDVATVGVVDDRAVASGKRRASPARQAEARAEVARQAEARRAAGGRR